MATASYSFCYGAANPQVAVHAEDVSAPRIGKNVPARFVPFGAGAGRFRSSH
jgi:hypothetical protein